MGQIFYSDMTVDNRFVISPAGFDNMVIIIEVATGKVVKCIVTGFTPVAVKVFENFAFVTHPRDEHITKINLSTFETENFNTASGTNGIALLPFIFPAAHKKLTLGVALPFSGKDAQKATDMIAGYEFWKLYVNNAGGLWIGDDAFDINIIYLDTQSDESFVIKLTEELIKNHKVNILLPTYGERSYQLEYEMAVKNHVPLVPNQQHTDKKWQPNDRPSGKDYFITSKNFDQLFESHFKMKTSYLAASSTAAGIVLQQALLTSKSVGYDELMAVFLDGHFHTFLDKTG